MTPAEIVAVIDTTFTTFQLPSIVGAAVGDQFRDANPGAAGIRPAHALATLERPDSIEVFGFDEPTIALAVRHISGTHPYDQLVEATVGGGAWRLSRAWRLYRHAGRPPRQLFAQVIGAYGIEAVFGGLAPTTFLGRLEVPGFKGDPSGLFSIPGGQGKVVDVSAVMQVHESGDMTLAWGYAFDRHAYLRGAADMTF